VSGRIGFTGSDVGAVGQKHPRGDRSAVSQGGSTADTQREGELAEAGAQQVTV